MADLLGHDFKPELDMRERIRMKRWHLSLFFGGIAFMIFLIWLLNSRLFNAFLAKFLHSWPQ